jgi:hypothetical protein
MHTLLGLCSWVARTSRAMTVIWIAMGAWGSIPLAQSPAAVDGTRLD